jgi:exosortase/archaeosortase family protein
MRSGTQNTPVAIRGGHWSPLFGWRYPLIVAAIAAPLFAIYCYPYVEGGAMAAGIRAYLSDYAEMVGIAISAFDPHVVVRGNRIDGRMFSISIVKTCDAMEVNILLAAALAGFPMPTLRRLVTIFVSVLSLILLNVFRLCVLYWLGAHAPTWFDRAHEILAPLFMVACALAIFLIATLRANPRPSQNPTPTGATS